MNGVGLSGIESDTRKAGERQRNTSFSLVFTKMESLGGDVENIEIVAYFLFPFRCKIAKSWAWRLFVIHFGNDQVRWGVGSLLSSFLVVEPFTP